MLVRSGEVLSRGRTHAAHHLARPVDDGDCFANTHGDQITSAA